MTNGNKIANDLEFEDMIKGFDEPEKFLARQVRAIQQTCYTRQNCYPTIKFSRKQVGYGIGGLGAYTTFIIALVEAMQGLTGG